jgi:hypothetical protein
MLGEPQLGLQRQLPPWLRDEVADNGVYCNDPIKSQDYHASGCRHV